MVGNGFFSWLVYQSCNTYWELNLFSYLLYFCTGLSVTYLSGRKSSNVQQFGTYSEDDVDALRAIAEEPGVVDLFLTYPCIDVNEFFIILSYTVFWA
jgi:hypothetical protein